MTPPKRDPLYLTILPPAGLFLVMAAFVMGILWTEDNRYALVTGGCGFLLAAIYAMLRPRWLSGMAERVFHWSTGYYLNDIVLVGALSTSVFLVNLLGDRYPVRWDLTGNKIYTLSGQTIELLKGLKSPLTVKAFLADARGSTQEAMIAQQQRRVLRDMLKDYQRVAGDRMKVDYVDPYRDAAVVAKYGVELNATVILEYEGRKVSVPPDRLFTAAAGGSGRAPGFNGEEALTGALLDLLSGEETHVYFLEGHGERLLAGGQPLDYGEVKKVLDRERYVVHGLNLITAPAVPEDCDVLVVADPRRPMGETEKKKILDHVGKKGKGLFLLLDYSADGTGRDSWREVLEKLGLATSGKVALEGLSEMQAIPGSANVFIAHFGEHLLVDPLKSAKLPVVVQTGLPLERAKDPPKAVRLKSLFGTSDKGYGESLLQGAASFDPAADLAGPVDLGVAVAMGQKETPSGIPGMNAIDPVDEFRAVVVGDADLVADGVLSTFPGTANIDFFMNTLAWLSFGKDKTATIRPKTAKDDSIALMGHQSTAIYRFCVIAYPLFPLFFGFMIYWNRRSL